MSLEREILLQAISKAWHSHAQTLTVSLPAGCGCHVSHDLGLYMTVPSFKMAVIEIIDAMMLDDRADSGIQRSGAELQQKCITA